MANSLGVLCRKYAVYYYCILKHWSVIVILIIIIKKDDAQASKMSCKTLACGEQEISYTCICKDEI